MPKTKREINNDFITFSKRLRELRESLNMTQKEFAEHIGFTQATLSAYENSLKIPSLDIVMKISKKCETSIDWLCGLNNKKEQNNSYTKISSILSDIVGISNVSTISFLEIEKEDILVNKIKLYPIVFHNTEINKFIKDWIKVKDLYTSNTIDKDLYQIWIEKEVQKYNEKIEENQEYDALPF